MVLWSLSVKRAWFVTKEAQRQYPKLTSMAGASILDKASGKHVRVRIAGRVVTVEPALPDAVVEGTLDAAMVPAKFRAGSARRVSISSEAPIDIFNPLVSIDVASECMLGSDSHAPDQTDVDEIRDTTAALFRKCTVVAGTVPAMFVPLACITFETLLDSTADPTALSALGAQYLRMLKMCIANSPAAQCAYDSRCYGLSTAQLRADILQATRSLLT